LTRLEQREIEVNKRFALRMHDYIHRPDGKLAYNRELFAEIASKYNFITRALSFGSDAYWKDQLIEHLQDMENPQCLDLACGTGDITFRLAQKYPGGSILGLDLTKGMVARARLKNCHPNSQFVVGDMCRTRFADESFDIVTGGYALRNAPDLERALTEIRRVMRPGATAAFLDFSKPANRFFQRLEIALLKIWGSFWGFTLHRNAEVYTYIAESLKQFPDSEQLKVRLADKGLAVVWSKKHFFGFTETIVCEKR